MKSPSRAIGRLRGGADRLRRRVRRDDGGGHSRREYSATAGLPFDDEELESRLVWIVGSARTGSTWLVEQLCDPLRLEPKNRLGFRAPHTLGAPLEALPVNEFLISSHVAPALGDPIESDGQLIPATLNNYLGHKPAYLFARDFEQVWRPALRRLILVRLQAVEARAAREGLSLVPAPALVIKEVNGSHAADVVMSLFPRARMLFLVRDGRDVMDSLLHAVGKGGWLAEYEGKTRFESAEERLAYVRKAARDWACGIDAARRGYESHPPEGRRLVRYEDLLTDTKGTLGELAGWMGLGYSEDRLSEIVSDHAFSSIPQEKTGSDRKRRAATPGLWRENLTSAEQEAIAATMGDRLQQLGYPR